MGKYGGVRDRLIHDNVKVNSYKYYSYAQIEVQEIISGDLNNPPELL